MSCSGDSLDRFLHALRRATAEGRGLVSALLEWEEVHGFPSCATWAKMTLRIEAASSLSPSLIDAFGEAFRGKVVGHVGRDLIESCLHDERREVRAAAMGVVESWEDDDPEGPWRVLLASALEREGLCPECGAEACGCDDLEFDDQDDPFEPDESECPAQWIAEVQRRDGRARITVSTSLLPDLLRRLCDVDPLLTLAMIESVKVGHACVPDCALRVAVSPLRLGSGHVLRAWSHRTCFSIEPTAAEDRWLVFAYL